MLPPEEQTEARLQKIAELDWLVEAQVYKTQAEARAAEAEYAEGYKQLYEQGAFELCEQLSHEYWRSDKVIWPGPASTELMNASVESTRSSEVSPGPSPEEELSVIESNRTAQLSPGNFYSPTKPPQGKRTLGMIENPDI